MNFLLKIQTFAKKYYSIFYKSIIDFYKNKNVFYIVLCLFLTWITLSFVIMEYHSYEKFEVGKPAKRDVKANQDFSEIDEVATEIARKKAAESVPVIPSGSFQTLFAPLLPEVFPQVSSDRRITRHSP